MTRAASIKDLNQAIDARIVVSGALTTEQVQDAVAAMLAASAVVTAAYDDNAGTMTLTIAATAVTNAMLAGSIALSKLATDPLARANHTGTQSADTLTDGTTNKAFLATERTKLAGVATSATANSSDATLLARANHTGTQPASTISDFVASLAAVAGKIASSSPTAGIGYAAGAGGTVAQTPNRTSTVVLNTVCGRITTATTSLAAAAETSFTVTNSAVAVGDVISLMIVPGGTGTPFAYVSGIANGSFVVTITNFHATVADTSNDVIYFFVNKAVIA